MRNRAYLIDLVVLVAALLALTCVLVCQAGAAEPEPVPMVAPLIPAQLIGDWYQVATFKSLRTADAGFTKLEQPVFLLRFVDDIDIELPDHTRTTLASVTVSHDGSRLLLRIAGRPGLLLAIVQPGQRIFTLLTLDDDHNVLQAAVGYSNEHGTSLPTRHHP